MCLLATNAMDIIPGVFVDLYGIHICIIFSIIYIYMSLLPWSTGKLHTLQPQLFNFWLSTEANLLRSYSALTDEVFKESNKPDAKQRMVSARGSHGENAREMLATSWVTSCLVQGWWGRIFSEWQLHAIGAILNRLTRGIGNLMLQDKYVKACIWDIW